MSGCDWSNLTGSDIFFTSLLYKCSNRVQCVINSSELFSLGGYKPCGINRETRRDTVRIWFGCTTNQSSPFTNSTTTIVIVETTSTASTMFTKSRQLTGHKALSTVELALIVVCVCLFVIVVLLLIAVILRLRRLRAQGTNERQEYRTTL